MASNSNWYEFLWPGDEWLVSYSSPGGDTIKLFMIGHALELYLKACYAKQNGNDCDKAIKFGHGIKGLWDACKAGDNAFMPDYELRSSIHDQDLFTEADQPKDVARAALSQDDYEHFMANQEFYIIAKMLADLKYSMGPAKKKPFNFTVQNLSEYWRAFFKAFRLYLGWPAPGFPDVIGKYLPGSVHYRLSPKLPDTSIVFLQGLYPDGYAINSAISVSIEIHSQP